MAWHSLGSATPVLENRIFFSPSMGAGEIFKADFPNYHPNIDSFGWLAWQYQGENLENLPFSQSVRIYPSFYSQLLFYPFPIQLLDLGYNRRQFAIKKSRKDLTHLWTINIEELIL